MSLIGLSSLQQNLLTMEQIVTVEETQIKDKKCILLRIKGGKQFVLQCEVGQHSLCRDILISLALLKTRTILLCHYHSITSNVCVSALVPAALKQHFMQVNVFIHLFLKKQIHCRYTSCYTISMVHELLFYLPKQNKNYSTAPEWAIHLHTTC